MLRSLSPRRLIIFAPITVIVVAFAIGVVFVTTGGTGSGGAPEGGFAIAGRQITAEEIAGRAAELTPSDQSNLPAPVDARQIRDAAATQLLIEALILEEAEKRGISVAGNDRERLAQAIFQTPYTELGDLQKRTIEIAQLQSAIQDELLAENPADISERAMRAWWERNSAGLATPTFRNVRVVAGTTSAEADRFIARLRAGEDFEKVYASSSEGAGSPTGVGGIQAVVPGSYTPEVVRAIHGARTGSVVGPFRVAESRFLAVSVIEDLVPERGKSFEQSTVEIRAGLREEKRQSLWREFLDSARSGAEASIDDPEGLLPPANLYTPPSMSGGTNELPPPPPNPALQQRG
ncbi:peptidylprolyl isomerase [Miltoncostaea oceani]|uniref:peptidylprolyl isomerase n=1 Tax=Miltoncostaea oceani TaxID=2843216 RepID=UPI001C3DA793|nr:SurA N-terminal domain-containing protein [Miltoncostaea oceani]